MCKPPRLCYQLLKFFHRLYYPRNTPEPLTRIAPDKLIVPCIPALLLLHFNACEYPDALTYHLRRNRYRLETNEIARAFVQSVPEPLPRRELVGADVIAKKPQIGTGVRKGAKLLSEGSFFHFISPNRVALASVKNGIASSNILSAISM